MFIQDDIVVNILHQVFDKMKSAACGKVLSHRAKLVYIFLKDYAGKDGISWPGINTVAAGGSLPRSNGKARAG